MSDWTLHYWIRGQLLDAWHTIQVPSKIDTLKLKQLIYDIHHESLIGGQSIHIYKVPDNEPVLLGDSTKHTLAALTLEQLCFVELRDLTKYFKPPIPGDQLHLIFNASFNICCWVRGADFTSGFIIHLSMADMVFKLKNAIKTKLHDSDHFDIPTSLLRLYKILPSVDMGTLLTFGSGKLLESHQFLGDVFNDVPFSAIPCVAIDFVFDNGDFWLNAEDICEDMDQLGLDTT